MNIRLISISDPDELRLAANNPRIKSIELFRSKENGHLFKVGEERELTGLEDFPEFNRQKVKITAIRENGESGRAYYIEGPINQFLNWVYEYRLA